MERESFEAPDVSKKINSLFIPIKVDREERPDIDSIYMSVCQAMTGSGGWPLTVFLTPEKKPFYVGTYFPKYTRFNMVGLMELLDTLSQKWKITRGSIFDVSERITGAMKEAEERDDYLTEKPDETLVADSYNELKTHFDHKYGGFSRAPKFPSPHNMLFLLKYYEATKEDAALSMTEKTLNKMYIGGIYDHIGGGFSRYSTDEKWLVPHFEKMLYDNALLIMAYAYAYKVTSNELYKDIANKTCKYVFNELTDLSGSFYCAQDADSEGIEGKYYVFTPQEITNILGEKEGAAFCRHFGITEKGNFEGKSIPNLLNLESSTQKDGIPENQLEKVYLYRKNRTKLHLDDKILTSWNSLMITALTFAYKYMGNEEYLKAALCAAEFIENNLSNGDMLFTSYREGKRSESGFIDDYAFYIWSLIELYGVVFEKKYLIRARELTRYLTENFWDDTNGGFYLYGKDSEQFFLKPKEVYDGAIPSGNSVMAYNLLMLGKILKDEELIALYDRHMVFMRSKTSGYPQGSGFLMYTILEALNPPKEIVCVLGKNEDINNVKQRLDKNALVTILEEETGEYKLINGKSTYYICENNMCLPPVN
ncbi:spermatogenesis-associated protein 20 [Holotrichia oblita]|nr:spermatogenesis-associated protein 20 [Holotrichia oblita]